MPHARMPFRMPHSHAELLLLPSNIGHAVHSASLHTSYDAVAGPLTAADCSSLSPDRKTTTKELVLEHVSPATRLLEKRRQMFEVQEALENQKQEFNLKVEMVSLQARQGSSTC